MTKQEIREIIENEINLRDATPNQVNKSVKLILASHLRSKIKLVKLMTEYLRCNGDKNAILHYKAILKEFNDKLNQ